jgi:hypothetical protein
MTTSSGRLGRVTVLERRRNPDSVEDGEVSFVTPFQTKAIQRFYRQHLAGDESALPELLDWCCRNLPATCAVALSAICVSTKDLRLAADDSIDETCNDLQLGRLPDWCPGLMPCPRERN